MAIRAIEARLLLLRDLQFMTASTKPPFAPRALIDHAALRHNLARAREASPGSRIWAVIKANAYGHGIVRVARALDAADGFSVARIGEGMQLRAAGIDHPILLLEGVFTQEEFATAAEANLAVSLHTPEQFEQLEQAELLAPLDVWIKVDTGMHRLGFSPGEAEVRLTRLMKDDLNIGAIGVMTHLANADDKSDSRTLAQCEQARDLADRYSLPLSIGNSAGILGWQPSRTDWVRPGIMLYGSSPFVDGVAADEGLLPVMTLQAELIAIRHCYEGDALGYGGGYVCPKDMPVGIIGVGYGDGYPRHAAPGTPVVINGYRAPLVGRVSMDMIMVDLSDCADARVGNTATLWGRGLPVEEVAACAETISYELLCNVAARVDFIDIEGDEAEGGEG